MPVIHLQYASEGRWRSPGVMNGIALNWVALPVSPPRVRFEVSVLGESWLGMGVSADGKMAFSPAIIAAWPRSQEARGDQRDPTKAGYLAPTEPPKAMRYQLEGYAPAAVRLLPEDKQPHPSATKMTRADGLSLLQLDLGFTDVCGAGKLAVCRNGPTTLIIAKGSSDTWARRHPPDGMYAIKIRIPPVEFTPEEIEQGLEERSDARELPFLAEIPSQIQSLAESPSRDSQYLATRTGGTRRASHASAVLGGGLAGAAVAFSGVAVLFHVLRRQGHAGRRIGRGRKENQETCH